MPSIRETGKLFSESPTKMPAHYLIAHSDGGARGNPGPAGYGVVIHDEGGRKIAALSQYLGHQTNNFAEYQGLIAALEDRKSTRLNSSHSQISYAVFCLQKKQ